MRVAVLVVWATTCSPLYGNTGSRRRAGKRGGATPDGEIRSRAEERGDEKKTFTSPPCAEGVKAVRFVRWRRGMPQAASLSAEGTLSVPLPIPYPLPPTRYTPEDQPWIWDIKWDGIDSRGLEMLARRKLVHASPAALAASGFHPGAAAAAAAASRQEGEQQLHPQLAAGAYGEAVWVEEDEELS